MKKLLPLITVCVLLCALALAAACSASPAGALNAADLAADAVFTSAAGEKMKSAACKGENEGGFDAELGRQKTFNSAYIAAEGEDVRITISSPEGELYNGAGGYCVFASASAQRLSVRVSAAGKWKISEFALFNAPAPKAGAAAQVTAADVLAGKYSAADFEHASHAILRANVLFDADGNVSYHDVDGKNGAQYFAAAAAALKELAGGKPILMHADALYRADSDDLPDPAHLRYSALRDHRYATASNLSAAVRAHGLNGLHIDFSDSPNESTVFYYLADFARVWKSYSGTAFAATMRFDGALSRSEKLADTFAELFKEDASGKAPIDMLILTATEQTYDGAAEFAGLSSKFPLCLSLDCAADNAAGIGAFVLDCGAGVCCTDISSVRDMLNTVASR